MHQTSLATRYKKIIPITVAIAFFINSLDGSVLNVAVPTIAAALHEPPLILKLAITSYLISMGVFILISNWLAERFGTRHVFLTAVIVFGFGSLCCGLSQNLTQLVLSRLLQGAGGAMMMPVGRLILNKVYPRSEIFKLMAMIAMVGLLGPALGPITGGIIISFSNWRWIFFINLPFALIGAILIARFIPNLKNPDYKKLDWIGFITVSVAVSGMAFGFSAVGQQALPITLEIVLLLVGMLSLIVYYWHQKHKVHPFINRAVFKINSYRVAVAGGSLSRVGIMAVSFLISLMCQLTFDLSPLKTALILLPFPLALVFSKPLVASVVKTISLRNILISNSAILALLVLTFAFLNPKQDLILLLLTQFLFGLSVSMQFSALQTLNIANATPELLGQMISFSSMLQPIAASCSVALVALCLQFIFTATQQPYSLFAFHITFAILAVFPLLAILSFKRLQHSDGADLTGHKIKFTP